MAVMPRFSSRLVSNETGKVVGPPSEVSLGHRRAVDDPPGGLEIDDIRESLKAVAIRRPLRLLWRTVCCGSSAVGG
jgi:hypothetical protein